MCIDDIRLRGSFRYLAGGHGRRRSSISVLDLAVDVTRKSMQFRKR